ncbi:diaminopimelate decarboxylase [Enterococcus sp. H57]|uniref:diaminopimelate decarboxylase n=1 Tax=Enterococcus sp. H57 TaxID=2035004 RepID=UPI000D595314|nr:diaminopimelate decarboxylase [Enterococcus sp. H57]EMF0571953.1 diaminopimelate decarboxylase [Enterococcus faecium]NTK91124.1 diaminopimelate decarboxylase [Enterococcus faecium]NTM35670.1 diaminopimelate decarboxylase [Enterococcus faecium]
MTELIIGGVIASTLAEKYKTPLYVYDEEKMRQTMLSFKRGFVSKRFDTKVLYASKAFQTIEMLYLVREYGFGLDVVSGGEIYTALQADFPRDTIYFHGNNKTPEELIYALENDLLHIVADNLMEVELLAELSQRYLKKICIMLRLNVGVEAHTHEYIVTAHIDSKFGMSYESKECQQALQLIKESSYLELEGFHAHIGSQIFDVTAWLAEIDKLTNYLTDFDQPLSLNLGGGFGIRYTQNDQPIPVEEALKKLIEYTEEALEKRKLTIRQLLIEPGRSIVGEAGTTLYTIGFIKKTPHKKYYFVDGGMTDNIRPALYQAEYDCDLAAKLSEEKTEKVTIAGKMCESGDVVIKEAYLPKAESGDLLAVYSTGAYGYSMSSNYNRATRPAVVFVNNGQSRLIVRRQAFSDLLRGEVSYDPS